MPSSLTWCLKEGVPKMIVTHCGSGIVTGEDEGGLQRIREFARERGVEVEVAFDGMEVVLTTPSRWENSPAGTQARTG